MMEMSQMSFFYECHKRRKGRFDQECSRNYHLYNGSLWMSNFLLRLFPLLSNSFNNYHLKVCSRSVDPFMILYHGGFIQMNYSNRDVPTPITHVYLEKFNIHCKTSHKKHKHVHTSKVSFLVSKQSKVSLILDFYKVIRTGGSTETRIKDRHKFSTKR